MIHCVIFTIGVKEFKGMKLETISHGFYMLLIFSFCTILEMR